MVCKSPTFTGSEPRTRRTLGAQRSTEPMHRSESNASGQHNKRYGD